MSAVASTTYFVLRADDARLRTDIAGAEAQIARSGTTLNRRFSALGSTIARGLGRAIKYGALGATAAIGGLAVASVKAAQDSAQVGQQTAAVLKSTGREAGVTGKQVQSLATEIMNYSGQSDEAVASTENLLLTFTNLRNEAGKGNDVFDQTTKLAVDMSQALGQDLKSSAIQLGKALNDPTTGLTALRRVGVSFTKQQQDQITKLQESGHLMEAQKLILAELTKEFGGSAAAMGDTFGGQVNILKEQLDNLMETLGRQLIPVLQKNLPAIGTVLKAAITSVGPALTQLFDALGKVLPNVLRAVGPLLNGFVDAFAAIARAISPVVRILARVLTRTLRQVMPAIKPVIAALGKSLVSALRTLAPYMPELARSFARILKALAPVLPDLTRLTTMLLRLVLPAVTKIADFLSGQLASAIHTAGGAVKWLADNFGAHFRQIQSVVTMVLNAVIHTINAFIHAYNAIPLLGNIATLPTITAPTPSPYSGTHAGKNSGSAGQDTYGHGQGGVTRGPRTTEIRVGSERIVRQHNVASRRDVILLGGMESPAWGV